MFDAVPPAGRTEASTILLAGVRRNRIRKQQNFNRERRQHRYAFAVSEVTEALWYLKMTSFANIINRIPIKFDIDNDRSTRQQTTQTSYHVQADSDQTKNESLQVLRTVTS